MVNNSQKSVVVKFTYAFHFKFDFVFTSGTFAQYTTTFYKKKGFYYKFFQVKKTSITIQ